MYLTEATALHYLLDKRFGGPEDAREYLGWQIR
jgi:hypothetical protein